MGASISKPCGSYTRKDNLGSDLQALGDALEERNGGSGRTVVVLVQSQNNGGELVLQNTNGATLMRINSTNGGTPAGEASAAKQSPGLPLKKVPMPSDNGLEGPIGGVGQGGSGGDELDANAGYGGGSGDPMISPRKTADGYNGGGSHITAFDAELKLAELQGSVGGVRDEDEDKGLTEASPEAQAAALKRSEVMPNPAKTAQLGSVYAALVKAEKAYHTQLNALVRYYKKPLSTASEVLFLDLEPSDVKRLFSTVDDIVDLHESVYDEIIEDGASGAIKAVCERLSDMRHYVLHAQHIRDVCLPLLEQMLQNRKFIQYLRLKAASTMGPSFYIALLSPLERFGQYVHSFEEMQQCFVAQSMDEVDDAVSTKEMLSEVVTRLQHLLVEVDVVRGDISSLAERSNMTSGLAALADTELLGQGQSSLHRGLITVVSNTDTQNLHFFLFAEHLLWTDDAYRLKDQIDLTSSWFEAKPATDDDLSWSIMQFAPGSHPSEGKIRLQLRCSDSSSRQQWITLFQQTVSKVRRK